MCVDGKYKACLLEWYLIGLRCGRKLCKSSIYHSDHILGCRSSLYSHAGSSPHERVYVCEMERYMACALNMCPYGL